MAGEPSARSTRTQGPPGWLSSNLTRRASEAGDEPATFSRTYGDGVLDGPLDANFFRTCSYAPAAGAPSTGSNVTVAVGRGTHEITAR